MISNTRYLSVILAIIFALHLGCKPVETERSLPSGAIRSKTSAANQEAGETSPGGNDGEEENTEEETTQFTHLPKPERCADCHERPEAVGLRAYPNQGPPADFDPAFPGTGGSHYLGSDCISCHQTPAEGQTAFVFTHSQPNPEACLPCHYNEGQAQHAGSAVVDFSEKGNCHTCHQNFNAEVLRNFTPN